MSAVRMRFNTDDFAAVVSSLDSKSVFVIMGITLVNNASRLNRLSSVSDGSPWSLWSAVYLGIFARELTRNAEQHEVYLYTTIARQ